MYISGSPCPVMHNGKSLIGQEAMKVIYERRNSPDQTKNFKPSMTWNKE